MAQKTQRVLVDNPLDHILCVLCSFVAHYVRYKQHTLFDELWQKRTGAKGIEMDCMTILGEENGKLKIFDTYMFSQKKL